MSTLTQISVFPASSASASRLSQLLQDRHPDIRVRLAARSPAKLQASGSNVSIAQSSLNVSDLASIKDALDGSDAAYIMNPPFYGEEDPDTLSKTFIDNIVAAANASSTLKKIVFLSSIGAEKASGTGPINNVRIAETGLLADLRDGVEAIALRPPYFFSNFNSVLPLAINPPHILPSMLLPFDKPYALIDSTAIAEKALKYLIAPPSSAADAASKGHITAVQLVTAPKTVPEIAQIVAEITGTPVNAVPVPEDQWLPTFQNAGMSDKLAAAFYDLTKASNTGHVSSLDQPRIDAEAQRGVAVITEHTDVDTKAALQRLIEEVKSA
jgi:hypothetical protein